MKKIYEAPKMSVETVCTEEMLVAGSIMLGDSSDKVTNLDEQALTKERDNSPWGGLLW